MPKTFNTNYELVNAAMSGNAKAVRKILDDEIENNNLALYCAAANGCAEIVKMLIEAGSDVHTNDDAALRLASSRGHVETVKVLLKAGADLHAEEGAALRWALENGHDEVVDLLNESASKNKSSAAVRMS